MRKRIFLHLLLLFFICSSSFAQLIIGSEFICLNSSTELMASDSFAQSYEWSTGEVVQSILVDVPGWYYLEMIDQEGNVLLDSTFLTLAALPNNSISLTGPEVICLGSSTSIEVAPDYLYQWSNGENDISISPTSSGSYFCILSDPVTGCESITDTIPISVYEFEGLMVESEDINCIGDEVILSSPYANIYQWSTGETSQSITVTESGTYTVNVDNGLCITELSENIIFNATPVVDLGPDVSLCEGDSLMICGPLGVQLYEWCNGENTQCISVNAENSTICLTAYSFIGCESSDTIEIEIANAEAPIIEVLNGTANACKGDTLILQSNLPVHSWSTGSITQGIEVTESGDYWLIATNVNGCTTDTGILSVSFNELPEALIYSDEELLQCPEDDFSLTLSTDEFDSYLWNVFSQGQELNIDEPGEYYVIVADEYGCTDTSEIAVVGLYDVPTLGIISGNENPIFNSMEEYLLTDIPNVTYHWNADNGTILGDSTGHTVIYRDIRRLLVRRGMLRY